MSESSDRLDQRLDRLFGSVQLSAHFDARLMARVNAESARLEQDGLAQIEGDYRRAVVAARQRGRRLLRSVTLDLAAAVALLIFGEAVLLRALQTVPAGIRVSALWHAVSSNATPALSLLVLIPVAVIAAILWTILDYGRSPE
jgi:hypothetical protein